MAPVLWAGLGGICPSLSNLSILGPPCHILCCSRPHSSPYLVGLHYGASSTLCSRFLCIPHSGPELHPQQRVWEGEQIEQRESLLHNHGDPLLSSPAPFLVPRPLPESFSSTFGTLRSATTHLASVLLPSPPRPSLFSLTMAGVGGSVRCSRCGAQRFAAVAICMSLAQQRPALVQPPGATLGNRRL